MADDDLGIPDGVADAMRQELPSVAEQTVAAIVVEVPSYADAFGGEMGRTIENAVQLALGGFLVLASSPPPAEASTRNPPRASWTAFSIVRPISPPNASA